MKMQLRWSQSIFKVLTTTASLLACGIPVRAGEPSVANRDQFEQHVRPMLLANCMKCHDDQKQEGGLKLTTMEGLPPNDETASLLQSEEGGYESLVDQLLEDSSFGENQAKFWLDLARYADSDGYNADHARPEAHHFRDYVIRSFNDDKPYERFVLEQLAGDEVDPGNSDALIGTMFLRHWIYDHNPTGFTMWMAGGGVDGGQTYGTTDALGLHAVEDRLHVHDIHSTILHLMGVNHQKLVYMHKGRPERIDQNEGHAYTEIAST